MQIATVQSEEKYKGRKKDNGKCITDGKVQCQYHHQHRYGRINVLPEYSFYRGPLVEGIYDHAGCKTGNAPQKTIVIRDIQVMRNRYGRIQEISPWQKIHDRYIGQHHTSHKQDQRR